jgi:hypothetical protein
MIGGGPYPPPDNGTLRIGILGSFEGIRRKAERSALQTVGANFT